MAPVGGAVTAGDSERQEEERTNLLRMCEREPIVGHLGDVVTSCHQLSQ